MTLNHNYIYLAGDFNMNLLDKNSHPKTGQFYNLLLAYGLIPLITRPTRCSLQSHTLIDNIFTNNTTRFHSWAPPFPHLYK